MCHITLFAHWTFTELTEGGFRGGGGSPFLPDGGPDVRLPVEPGGGAHKVGVLRRRVLRLPRRLLLLHQQHVSITVKLE